MTKDDKDNKKEDDAAKRKARIASQLFKTEAKIIRKLNENFIVSWFSPASDYGEQPMAELLDKIHEMVKEAKLNRADIMVMAGTIFLSVLCEIEKGWKMADAERGLGSNDSSDADVSDLNEQLYKHYTKADDKEPS